MRTKLAMAVAFGSVLSVAPTYAYSGKIAFKDSEAAAM